MKETDLIWKIQDEKELLHTPVFDVLSRKSESMTGICGNYVALKAPSWVLTIPEYDDKFVLVRQWRHGLSAVTTEFPGGIADGTETPEQTAARELKEETGFIAGKVTLLGSCNPNPALFTNKVYFCLAEDLTRTDTQQLDEDEVISYLTVNKEEVINSFCSGEYVHALMGTALALYMRHRNFNK